ncbi:MAG: anthranilate phosphoribosyltransferase [Nitrospirae bacterium]|nr:anthranilate phosphoribosyltransferase [Nitrospirota bacterium]
MIKEALAKIIERTSLREEESETVMEEIMNGQATPAQIGAYLTSLRMKGETVEEITGAARVMRKMAVRLHVHDVNVVDTCGTGGDRLGTFNISTTTAFVVAGAGLTVAKHGNRSVSSRSGSADVLKALGVNIDLPPKEVERCINDLGIGFLFAPLYHGAMKHAAGPRQEIGIRTLFNILGPLTNPAGAACQVLGVFREDLTELLAHVLLRLGAKHCFVVHGSDGLDEITVTGETRISEGKEGRIRTYAVRPGDFEVPTGTLQDLKGGGPEENALITRRILQGENSPRRNVVLMNAAAAIVAGGKAKDLREAFLMAERSIDSGAAWNKLEALKNASG